MKLNKGQREVTADIFGNLAVGWFGAGIIVPTFTQTASLQESAQSFIVGLTASLVFYFIAIYIVRR